MTSQDHYHNELNLIEGYASESNSANSSYVNTREKLSSTPQLEASLHKSSFEQSIFRDSEELALGFNYSNEEKVPLTANNNDSASLSEKTHGDGTRKNWWFGNITTKVGLLIASILLMVIASLSIDLTVSSSCQNTHLPCLPQLTVKPTDDTPKAKITLITIREGLKMISYLAKDLGVDSHDLESDLDYLNTIDTFSTHNLYEFNSNGFCRYNSQSTERYCAAGPGLDIFSSLAADIGLQLGKVGGGTPEDSEEMAESMVLTYTNIVDLLDAIYYKAINNQTESKNLKMEQLYVAHNLQSIKSYGNFMTKVPKTTMSFSIAALAVVVVLFFMVRRKGVDGTHSSIVKFSQNNKSGKVRMNLLYGGCFTVLILHLAMMIGRIVMQIRALRATATFFDAYEIANVQAGIGQYLLFVVIVCDVVSLVFLSILMSSKILRPNIV